MSSAREEMDRAMRAAGYDPDEIRAHSSMLDADPGREWEREPDPVDEARRFDRADEKVEQLPIQLDVCPFCNGAGLVSDPETGGMRSCSACQGEHHVPAVRETGERNRAAARAAGEEGMARASRAERVQAWKQDADEWFEALPDQATFIADDLTLAIGLVDPSEPGKNNVLGAWVSGKRASGRIVWNGELRISDRVARHGGPQRVWRKQ